MPSKRQTREWSIDEKILSVAGGLAAAAVGIAIAALLVEPATAKAAFEEQ